MDSIIHGFPVLTFLVPQRAQLVLGFRRSSWAGEFSGPLQSTLKEDNRIPPWGPLGPAQSHCWRQRAAKRSSEPGNSVQEDTWECLRGWRMLKAKFFLSIFAVQEGPAGPQRGCFLITEEVRRWEISQQISSTVWLIWWVPIRKDPSPETDFSYLVWPNRRGKISVPRLLLGETSLFYLELYSEGWAAQFDWRRSSVFEDYTGTKTCMQALYWEAVIVIIVVLISGWRAADIHVKANKDFMKQSFFSLQCNLTSTL